MSSFTFSCENLKDLVFPVWMDQVPAVQVVVCGGLGSPAAHVALVWFGELDWKVLVRTSAPRPSSTSSLPGRLMSGAPKPHKAVHQTCGVEVEVRGCRWEVSRLFRSLADTLVRPPDTIWSTQVV